MNKKAALNLGISTVVVMVIAMVVIGAGVSFIRTFFDQGTDSLLGTMQIGEVGLSPDRNTPFAIQTSTIRLRPGSEGNDGPPITFDVGIFNSQTGRHNVSVLRTECSGKDRDINVSSVEEPLEGGDSVGLRLLISFNGTNKTQPASFICGLEAIGKPDSGDNISLGSQQITVEVSN